MPPPVGPVVSFLGLAQGDNTLMDPSGTRDGLPIYWPRPVGTGFYLVVEGMPGPNGVKFTPTPRSYEPDLTSFPDLQVEVSQPLGNGSEAVCDTSGPMPGGVPAISPPNFDPTQTNINIVNDLGCRFVDADGNPVARLSSLPCVKVLPSEEYKFANPNSTIEFCAPVTKVMGFPLGDTVVTARLRDAQGNVGAAAQIVVHVGP